MRGRLTRFAAALDRRATVASHAVVLLLLVVIWAGPARAQDGAEREAGDLPPEAGQSWWSNVQRQIQAAEYEVTWQDHTVLPRLEQAWHAPNRSQDLRTYFTGEGIRVVRRTETEPSWELGLSLIGYGRGDTLSPAGDARLLPVGNRIDYERDQIVEWYVNDSRGLEQGFTLHGPPEDTASANPDEQIVAGRRAVRPGEATETKPAYLVLALGGSVSPVISADGQAIDFAAPGGARVLHYAALKVTDAGGRELPAWMEGFAEAGVRGIRIVFDDAEAAYPVTVDPLLTTPAWTADGEQDYASFGYFVATAGDVNGDGYSDVIVGAYRYDNGDLDEGLAMVYHGTAGGLYSLASWSEEGNQAGAAFGRSVATAGDVNGDGYSDVIVGAYLYTNGQSGEGRAFVYHGSASGLSSTADWTAEGDQAGASLGVSVSTAGDVNGDGYSDVIVGAHMYDNPESNEGMVFVYHGSAGGLYTIASWTADGWDQVSANFGWSVSTAGDVNGDGYSDVIIGARSYDNGETDEGGAWVYLGSASGLSGSAVWSDESDQAGARLGHSVSTAGDVNGDGYADVVVGNYRYTNDLTDEGRAQVYYGSPSGPSSTPDWIAEGNQDSAYLGVFVSTAGDVNGDGYADLIVGAHGYDNPDTDEGRAYVYHGSASGLGPVANWTAESNQADAMLGAAVSTAGDVNGDGYSDVVIGAPYYTDAYTEEGRAFVYHGSSAGLSAVAGWSAESDLAGSEFGWSVSTAGDVNGDGYADVIVGARQYDQGESQEGMAFVYHGSSAGLSTAADWTAESNQLAAEFGWSVSTAGDVNGDGCSDVIVGAPFYSNGEGDEGRAFVYHGSPSGLSAYPTWTAESDMVIAEFGHAVSTAGDVNGDGYADVIIGAHQYESLGQNLGRAYVYHGSPSGLGAHPAWTVEGECDLCLFGGSVSTAGDVNRDGYDDVIIGEEFYGTSLTAHVGRAYVYHGSPSGLGTVAAWTEDGEVPYYSFFGVSVSTAGDVNGDGYADVIIGDNGYYELDYSGKAYVYQGSASGLRSSPSWTAEGEEFFGGSVSTAGDVNGDGYADVIIGVYDADHWDARPAWVYHGSASGLSTTVDWAAGSGSSVSTAGDVNGDGYAEVIVGCPSCEDTETDEGKAFLYYGNAGAGLSLRPQQRRVDDLSPIVAGGRSRESGSFRLAALGHTPFGRGRIKLEWEVKPLGQSVDGTGTGQTDWTDTGTAGATFNELIAGLEPGAHHWRMRLLYDTATTPLAGASRWFTVPWNGWQERDLTVSPFIGGKVWEDCDWDGLMESGEPGLWGVMVRLLDESGTTLQVTVTNSSGEYRFDVGSGGLLKVRFELPDGWFYTLPDQGIDDFADSDADTVTGETALIMPPFDSLDELRWSAGLRRVGICTPPDEPVYIYSMRLSTDGNDYPILDFQDPNQPGDVTGYNVYRSSDDGLPPGEWPLIADDVVDMDEAEPNKQWVDTTGDEPPGGIWYYQVTAFNHNCPAEGPH